MNTVHLGDLLVRNGVLTERQRDEVLAAQRERGGPFGAIAEQMFGVSPSAVERAWAEQYSHLCPHVDPRAFPVQSRALESITKRQAWQFRVLPLQWKGAELILCTTQEALPRALKFAGWRLGHGCLFVLADPLFLGEAMMRHYPMAGMTAAAIAGPMEAS
jgi:hypothetical protein